jgi:HAMP domain-containing protein
MERGRAVTDIVERLRALCGLDDGYYSDLDDIHIEAADEIERLNTYLDNQVRYYNERRQEDLAEIERLRKNDELQMQRAIKAETELHRLESEIRKIMQ